MSGSSAKIVAEINLDEYERRLRSAGASPSVAEDPLAELTRLVNMISLDSGKRDPVDEASQAHMPKAAAFPSAANDAPVARFESRASRPRDGAAGREPPPAPLFGEAATPPAGAAEELDLSAGVLAATRTADGEAEAGRGRSRSWRFKIVGLAAIGVALLGGAFAMKTGVVPGLPKTPPFIAAAEGPNKIQPPSDATVQSSGDTAALLMKDSATSAPVKVVSTEEQPVDLGAQTTNPGPVASAPASPAPSPAASATPSPAAAGSPVAPAADTPVVAPAEASATVAPLFSEAKPVKTVSVRPDGTLISVDAPPTPAPAPPEPPTRPTKRTVDDSLRGTAEPATPKLDLPTKLSPKSSARIVAKTDTTAPAAATDDPPNAPMQPEPSPRADKSGPPRSAAVVAAAAPTAAAEPDGAGAGWAVQLAAPRSEEDAQRALSRLKSKYAAELGGADLVVRKADVKGQTIYRVRAGDLSKADAAALCAKLKASGGDCFIAKN
jgi:hypothetical protein